MEMDCIYTKYSCTHLVPLVRYSCSEIPVHFHFVDTHHMRSVYYEYIILFFLFLR
jgi:hypothetical protein